MYNLNMKIYRKISETDFAEISIPTKPELITIDDNKTLDRYIAENNDIIKTLTDKITMLENKLQSHLTKYEFKTEYITYTGSNLLRLSKKFIAPADEKDFNLVINGIEYSEDQAYTVNREEGTVSWIMHESNLTLNSEMSIKVEYYYDVDKNK